MSKEKKQKIKNPKMIYFIFTITMLTLFIAIIYAYILIQNYSFEPYADLYDISGECSLSLCDCQCYFTEQMPEIVEGKVCGNDCYILLSIEGCEKINESCVIKYG